MTLIIQVFREVLPLQTGSGFFRPWFKGKKKIWDWWSHICSALSHPATQRGCHLFRWKFPCNEGEFSAGRKLAGFFSCTKLSFSIMAQRMRKLCLAVPADGGLFWNSWTHLLFSVANCLPFFPLELSVDLLPFILFYMRFMLYCP